MRRVVGGAAERKFVIDVRFGCPRQGVDGRRAQGHDSFRREKKNHGIHEAGHALVAAMTRALEPCTKVTLSSRHVSGLTCNCRKTTSIRTLANTGDERVELMGGRSAEEIFLVHITHRRGQ